MTTINLDIDETISKLTARHGLDHVLRIREGVERVAALWRVDDGSPEDFHEFCLKYFITDELDHDRLLLRMETTLEQIHGHLYEMRRNLRRWADLRGDEMDGVDELLAQFDPAPDLSEQLYVQKVAHLVLLNMEKPSLSEMLQRGKNWTSDQWAEARIAQSFRARVPKEVNDLARELAFRASHWVATFHVPVGTVVDSNAKRWFESERKLVAHWLIREELKSGYNETDGINKQRALAWILARHIDGTIPQSVMEQTSSEDWDPQTNRIGGKDPGKLLGLIRYQRWMDQVEVAKAFDQHYPDHPTALSRKFDLQREISEQNVEHMLVELLEAVVRRDLADLLRTRLGRDLESHDIYFDDLFESRPAEDLDSIVKTHFEDEAALHAKLPELLKGLGFAPDVAEFLGSHIRVEIAKGAGHAMRPMLHQYDAWLRTNRLDDQLGWDGFETAMHELGHNIEQLFSCYYAPRPSLQNVPNTACTEAFAFLYQSLSKRVIGIEDESESEVAFGREAISSMLMACQIAGPSLVELRTWRWIYANPDADPSSLRETVLGIADEVWDSYFRVDFGEDPYHLLAAYQHMVAYPLYLADYALGQMISHQIREFVQTKDVATETQRICSIGRKTPDAWMHDAVGSAISPAPLINAATAGLAALRQTE